MFRYIRLRRVCRCIWGDVCAGYEGSWFPFWSSKNKGARGLVFLSASRIVMVHYTVFMWVCRCIGGILRRVWLLFCVLVVQEQITKYAIRKQVFSGASRPLFDFIPDLMSGTVS